MPLSRRQFLQSTIAISGGLLLSIRSSASTEIPAGLVDDRSPSGFLHIGRDNTITITVPGLEMGQGSHTALPMILMDELEGDWSKMRWINAPVADIYKNPLVNNQASFGSATVRGWFYQLRDVGAAAREMLVSAAANHWGVPKTQIIAANSVLTHNPSGNTLSYGQVAEQAASLPRPNNPVLKSPEEFRFIGKSVPRTDAVAKSNGTAIYGIDIRLPDMLYAAVTFCPTFGGKLKTFNDSEVKKLPGYVRTVPLENGVAVVAESYWQAERVLKKIQIDYDAGPIQNLTSKKVFAALNQGLEEKSGIVRKDGDAEVVLKNAANVIEADYQVPYLAHACMEPMNCTVVVNDENCEIWVGSQAPGRARSAAARLLEMPEEQVKVHSQFLGGGFGRRGASDFVEYAVSIARAIPGRPVKMIWSREMDVQHGLYRPAVASRYRAVLDNNGEPKALSARVVTSAVPGFKMQGTPIYLRGVADMPYAIANIEVSGDNKELGVPFGFWRSVAHSHTPFGVESFIDELAHAAGKDPYRFRRSLLQQAKARRYLQVLDLAADKAGWDNPVPKGRGRGIAVVESYGSYIAAVAEVSAKDGKIFLHRITCGFDCGINVDPDNTRAQIEGGLVWGLTAALWGEISIDNGAVQQSNFDDYRMLSMKEMPEVEVHILPSNEFPGGVGEPGAAPIAPALVNAIYAATGQRVRSLPLSKHGLTTS